jgi:WD40 repeat protein
MTLDNPPNDHISSLKFSPTDPFLLASSSWDKLVQVYHIKSNTITQSFTLSSALLDVCFAQDGLSLFTGGLDKTVSLLDLQTGSIVALGKHDDGVKSIVTSANLLFSGSWDKTIKVWDPRSEDALVDTLFQSDKV